MPLIAISILTQVSQLHKGCSEPRLNTPALIVAGTGTAYQSVGKATEHAKLPKEARERCTVRTYSYSLLTSWHFPLAQVWDQLSGTGHHHQAGYWLKVDFDLPLRSP